MLACVAAYPSQDKARQGDKAFLQLRQAQQMASVVGRKKEDLAAKNERLQEKKTALTAQLDKLNAEGEGVVGGDWTRGRGCGLAVACVHGPTAGVS